jgi:hypothetical protein
MTFKANLFARRPIYPIVYEVMGRNTAPLIIKQIKNV